MKNILQLTTAQDVADWAKYSVAVASPNIAVDTKTQLNRVAIVKNLDIQYETAVVNINVAVYLLDASGNPINGYMNAQDRNILPIEVAILATNETYVNLSTLQVESVDNLIAGTDYLLPAACESLTNLAPYDAISNAGGLPAGVSHLPEFEAYRLMANTNPIDLPALQANAIVQSTKL